MMIQKMNRKRVDFNYSCKIKEILFQSTEEELLLHNFIIIECEIIKSFFFFYGLDIVMELKYHRVIIF
jgi:hypothetical protein